MLEAWLSTYFRFRRMSFIRLILWHFSRTINLNDVVTHFFIKILSKGVRWLGHVSEIGGGISRITLSWVLLITPRWCKSWATVLSIALSTAVTYLTRLWDGLTRAESGVYFRSSIKDVVWWLSVNIEEHWEQLCTSGRNLCKTEPSAYRNPSSSVPRGLYVGFASIRMQADDFSSRWWAGLAGRRSPTSAWIPSAAWNWPMKIKEYSKY
jgi:hypothetical protein